MAAFERQFHLELHLNTTPSGRSTPHYPGEITSAHGIRLTPEFGYGPTPDLEAGPYGTVKIIFEIPFD